MNSDDVQVTESGASEIDAEAIMRQIRGNIRVQRAQAEAQGLDYEAFVEEICGSQDSTRFDCSLYDALRRMSVSYDKVGVRLSLSGSSIPLIAPLVQRLRGGLHHLVIYYVNHLAGQQVRFNERVVRALATLVKELEKEPTSAQAEALQQEVAQLRIEVERLRAKVEQKDENE